MPPYQGPTLITLRRQNSGQPWGFHLSGGVNQTQPYMIHKVSPGSVAQYFGVHEGDSLVRIGNTILRGKTPDEVDEIISRCNVTIDLFVVRNQH